MKHRLRLKGTDIFVEAICYDSALGGIKCKYLNGEYKGSYETIKGDCLIEDCEQAYLNSMGNYSH